MSDLLRPARTVRDEIPVRQFPQPSKEPQLLWPSIRYGQGVESHDAPYFPSRENVWGRYTAVDVKVLKLVAFEAAMMEAELRILVLDPYFEEVDADVLGSALSLTMASDIRLLTGQSTIAKERREQLQRWLTQYRDSNRVDARQVEVRWSATLDRHRFPFLHDRFAIVDGGLWHFGSTVGGGHRGLTAASGPWSAAGARATEFFDECWRLCHA